MNREKVLRIIGEQFDVPPSALGNETNLFSDLGADSLAVVAVMNDLERDFDVDVSNEDTRRCKTVGDVVAMIDRLTA